MIEKVLNLVKELPHSTESKFLLAVSGGIDSMVLLSIFKKLKLKIAVAHCNFQLRGKDSEKDQELVSHWCETNNTVFFTKKFEVEKLKNEKGYSIQMAARELRYNWFEELLNDNELDFVVTAHHLDDDIETLFLNLSRGTGLSGVAGMQTLSGFILRPLLSFSKLTIEKFAQDHGVVFREDKSNEDTHYKRNKVRLDIVPQFLELNPSFVQTMKRNLAHIKSVESFYRSKMEEAKSQFLESLPDGNFRIPLSQLEGMEHRSLILFEILKTFGFNETQVGDLIQVLDNNNSVGKQIFSQTNWLLVERNYLLISEKKNILEEVIVIKKPEKTVTSVHQMSFKKLAINEFKLITDEEVACLDAEKIEFPLNYRKWREGDKFRPLGMKGNKKVSDYLIDEKISRKQKEQIYVLETNGKICWVIGKRIDERFKITQKTKEVLLINLTT